MKKLFYLVLMLVIIFCFSVCQASISDDKMNAGGVSIGQSISEVKSKLGKPVSVEKYGEGNIAYNYVDDKTCFRIYFYHRLVNMIKVSGDNGIATSDGIKIGTPMNEVIKILGEPDYVRTETVKKGVLKILNYYGATNSSYLLRFDVIDDKVDFITIFGVSKKLRLRVGISIIQANELREIVE